MQHLILIAITSIWLNSAGAVKYSPSPNPIKINISNTVLSNFKAYGDETAIYNQAGTVIGWIKSDIIYNNEGNRAVAFIDKDNVFSFGNGNAYLGRFHNGFFRDKTGNAVAWVQGASGDPITLPALTRVSPVFMPVIKPIAPMAFVPATIDTLAWSTVSWDDFIGQ